MSKSLQMWLRDKEIVSDYIIVCALPRPWTGLLSRNLKSPKLILRAFSDFPRELAPPKIPPYSMRPPCRAANRRLVYSWIVGTFCTFSWLKLTWSSSCATTKVLAVVTSPLPVFVCVRFWRGGGVLVLPHSSFSLPGLSLILEANSYTACMLAVRASSWYTRS